ncbi:uncharacterized protein LOC129283892 [Lytechinus pictus]|uniref:uncharacterized protein LOC129283892 n=1 Tax=Lytechinus pictus TaxID=7653 RepID=UPI0030B9DD74
MENEERVICLCRECKRERYVSQRTARRHSSLKRKIDDDQGEVPNRPSLESNIFNGSDHTLKQAIAMVMKIYSDFPQVSQAAITSFLQVLKELFPAGNLVPESYRAAHTMIKSQLTPVQEFHVCPNDHDIFTGELSNVENCPTCGTCRYNSDGTPVKKFQYLPLIPRLQRWSLVPKLRDLLSKAAPNDINPYLHPLVEELKVLDEGILIDDKEATTPATTLKGRLMVGIYDTPGRAKVVVKKVISLLTEHQSAKMIKAEGKRRKISKEVPVVHLTKEERRVADTRILNIRTPKHLVFNPKPFFSSYVYMRSADYRKLATEGILKYALRGMLGERQRKTLFALCDSIRDLCSGKCDDETIDAMDTKLQEVLARVERDFPRGLQTICFHLMHHFPDALRQLGPTVGWWMYPYERMLGNISQGIRNRKTPEANAVENYRISEFVKICEMTGEMPQLTDSSAPQTQTKIVTTSSKEVVNTTTDSSVVCLVEVGRNNEHQTHFGRIEVVSGEEAYVARYADIRLDTETDLRYAPLPQTNKRKSTNTRGGGVLISVRSHLLPQRLLDLESPDIEMVICEITLKKKMKWNVCSVYRPPNSIWWP